MPSCLAVRHMKAGQCTHRVYKEDLCKMHYNSMKAKGPKTYSTSQMTIRHENERMSLKKKADGDEYIIQSVALRVRQRIEYHHMLEWIHDTPDTPEDVAYIENVRAKNMKRKAEHEARFARIEQERLDREARDEREGDDGLFMGIQVVPMAPVPFHEDRQNIHLAVTVNEVVKKTIQKVITIPVPADYRWNTETVAKTLGEIIAECKLSIAAARLLSEKYLSEETIYDMVPGIYGKTLDSVWQFIKGHADKVLLIKTLKTELEDNIDMCAQGNLTRLCNVLQGYLDDMPAPPIAEILGDLLPPLAEIEDREVRREKALQIMRTHNVPDDQQEVWLEPLMA